MKKKNIFHSILAGAACLLAVTSCSVEPEFYTQVVPETFYTSQDAVWQRFNRPFTHWRWWAAHNEARWMMQEIGTDEFCLPTRGSDWYNGAKYQKFHHHEYTEDMAWINTGWTNVGMGVALAWDALQDLEAIDFDKLGFEAGTRESMLAQQQALAAALSLDGLDFFGGLALYRSTNEEIKGRSTDVETFNFIDSLLTDALPKLPMKNELGAMETGQFNQAAGAMLRARLYFNAEAYIGKPMYTEAAQICQDVINGKYGKYELDTDYRQTFGFNNEYSTEIILTVPSQNAQTESDGAYLEKMAHYNFNRYLGGIDIGSRNNGIGLIPSLKPTGEKYEYKLGGAYGKFHDLDVRKQTYVYEGDGNYRGIFVVGKQVNPVNPEWTCNGGREYAGKVIEMVDMVGYISQLTTPGKEYYGKTLADLPSTIAHAEENSCIRLVKRSPRPTVTDKDLRGNPDIPIIRLAEAYYTLAECKMRSGDKAGAAELINKVRARYFEDADPDPVTAANLDEWRMLDEWMVEFLGEGRRRTDLVRWDKYVTEDWWDHKATNNPALNRFPIHYGIIGANNLLEQNPGY